MNVQNWHGFNDGRFGYGAMLNGFLSGLPQGVQVSPLGSVDVLMSVPFAIKSWYEGAHRVIFTMWETDVLPERFRRWLPQYDQVVVPCAHNVEVFGPHHPKVSAVPLGVDARFWKPYARPENDRFVFTAGGSLWKRKGLDLVVEAFRRAKLPDAELRIKAAPHASDVPKMDVPGVVWFREWMSVEEERDFYNRSDCFVAPARGEGFGLIPLQNIALGVPTIVTATSGQREFANLSTAVVAHRKVTAQVGRWDEADVGDLTELMRVAYQDRDGWKRMALEKSPLAGERFSWRQAAEKLVAALPPGERLTSRKVRHPSVEFPVRVSEKVTVEVNGKRWVLLPGQDNVVPENVADIAAEAGKVVP